MTRLPCCVAEGDLMVSAMHADFGWYPEPLNINIGAVSVSTLPDLDGNTNWVGQDNGVEGDWIYAPMRRQHVMGHGIRMLPYPSRIFGLPKTHRLTHAAADGKEHLDFLLWALGFFVGMRLTATEAGFIDATPIKLVDFLVVGREVERAMGLAERFWQANKAEPSRAKRWGAAVHALFIGQGPQLLQYERFIYLYSALDACFALASDLLGPATSRITHASRVAWLCRQLNMPIPAWADDTIGPASPLADIRNPMLHESLFMEAPLGFALHGVGTGQNLPLEMQAVICRWLVALLGDPTGDYVRSPVTTRMTHGWNPPL
jgi:hypothetical protein